MGISVKDIWSAAQRGNLKSLPKSLWYLQRRKGLRERITHKYGASTDPEISEVLAFLANHPLQELPIGMVPPYEWVQQYKPEDVSIEQDSGTGMWTTLVNGQRVFFPKDATAKIVQHAVCIASMEQDSRSPHRYVTERHNVDAGDVGVFVGASDGIFCLSLIERLSKAYLFEPDPHWVEPLRATMKPWSSKVEIVPLALGSRNANGAIRLDSFLSKQSQINFIQMDVEGSEWNVLQGAGNLLLNAPKLRLSICTYHNRLDYSRFARFLGGLGYEIGHSPGYYVIGVRMPYLRRGILHASRQRDKSRSE